MDPLRLGSVLRTRWGAASETGPRENNQDAWLASHPVFAVADGMGGHELGEVASRTALDVLGASLTHSDLDLVELDRAVCAAAVAVADLARDPLAPSAPGTTLTGAVVTMHQDRPHWLVFNAGDSRTYLAAGGRLQALTTDHAASVPDPGGGQATVITRFLGAAQAGLPTPDYVLLPAAKGDRLLLCSDGLHRTLTPENLALALTGGEPQAAATALTLAALTGGATDNVTALVVDCVEALPPWPDESPLGADSRELRPLRLAHNTTVPRSQGVI